MATSIIRALVEPISFVVHFSTSHVGMIPSSSLRAFKVFRVMLVPPGFEIALEKNITGCPRSGERGGHAISPRNAFLNHAP